MIAAALMARTAVVVVLAPSALVDHIVVVSSREDAATILADSSNVGELGGSQRVSSSEMAAMLGRATSSHPALSLPAGSAANVARNLAYMGHAVTLLTSCGADDWGTVFQSTMHAVGVDVSAIVRKHKGTTGGCAWSDWCLNVNHC
jgi:sugar/nucleoside kinase (ribokinase family)